MSDTIKQLFVISRPISWVNTAYPFAAGYLASGGRVDALLIIGTLYFLIPYNLLMYGVNDVFDYESDIKNDRKGGLEGAVAAKQSHPVILRAALLLNVPFLAALLWLGTARSALVLALVVFMVVAYSIAGLRFKERPFLDSITSSLHFVGPLLFALSLTGFGTAVWPYVIAFFLWGMASHAFGAVQDVIPDRRSDIASIATVIGARRTVRLAFGLYLLSAALVASQGIVPLVVGVAGLAYAANVAPYLAITDKTSGLANAGWRRFIWLNYGVGFVVTMALLYSLLR
ncbi:prenyltransferase [Candidatus Saccharibacteria bacterium]|nr:prenyltransferase [Candidatus Saccharibacteria bacterium]